jgi:nitrous oxidase accessory protein NosD
MDGIVLKSFHQIQPTGGCDKVLYSKPMYIFDKGGKTILIRRGLTLGVIILFFGMMFASSALSKVEQSSIGLGGDTLYVGGSGEGNYTKIQDAIDNASYGDAVFVYDDSSPYYENVIVNKSIQMIGENKYTTIIDGNENEDVVFVDWDEVVIMGFTITNSGNEYLDSGIYTRTDNNEFSGNILINNNVGIWLDGSTHTGSSSFNIVSDNICEYNEMGLYVLFPSTNNNISSNNFLENVIGIHIIGLEDDYYVTDCDISQNSIKNNTWGIITDALKECVFSENNIMGNDVGIKLKNGYHNVFRRNNFIENNVHFSFFYRLPVKIIQFFLFRPLQLNKFIRNYWDDNVILTPKVINGSLYCFELLYLLYYYGFIDKHIEPRSISWKNFDWFPALRPYNIGG